MLNGLKKYIVIFLCLLFVNVPAIASPLYQQYQAYEDASGNIYLQLPKQFVLIHSDISIPLHVYPTNALVKLYEENGVWKVQILTEAQFNALINLSPSDYNIEYLDFSGDGDVEVVLRADNVSDESFILYGLENDSISFSVHNKDADGIDLSKNSGAVFTDVNGDGYKDIKYSEYTLLGNAQDKFYNTSRYETAQATLVGTTGGDFRVAEDGSATYQIPLKLPQGIAGVTPQMAFSYSSNGGSSSMGRGWSLSGLTSISRCPKNYAQDGYIQGVQLTSADEYCYNGQRLIKSSGTHGSTNATYHTELASFSVITITSSNAQGATGFKVETKSGETHYYGTNTTHTTANAYVGNPLAPSAYLIAAIEDVKSNQISYTYAQESTTDEVNLDTVTWGASANPHELKVNYIDNPRPLYGYRYGRQFSQTKYISNVQLSQSSTLVRQYNLAWDHGVTEFNNVETHVAENISRVTAVQECLIDDDESEQCLAATEFDWSSTQTGTRPYKYCAKYEDLSQEGLGIVCVQFGTTAVTSAFEPFGIEKKLNGTYVSTELRNADKSLYGDANGDGLSDIFYASGGKWHLGLMTASGVSSNRYIRVLSTKRNITNQGEYQYAQSADLNGDGHIDLLYPVDNKWIMLYLNDSGLLVSNQIGTYINEEYKNAALLDVNGDSYIDLVTKTNTGLRVRYNYAGSFSSTTNELISSSMLANNFTTGIPNIIVQTPALKNTAFLDINGDGISDLLSLGKETTYYCELYEEWLWMPEMKGTNSATVLEYCNNLIANNKSKNYRYRVGSTSPKAILLVGDVDSDGVANYQNFYQLNFLNGIDLATDVRIADFNADGLSDIIYRSDTSWTIALSKGDGTFVNSAIPSYILNASDINKYSYHRFIDINLDGLTDLMAYNGSSFKIYLTQTTKDNIPSFTYRMVIDASVDNTEQLHIADFDGDTKLDIIYESGDTMYYRLAANSQQRDNVIDLITAGFGQTTEINYGLLHEDNNRIDTGSAYLSSLTGNRRTASDTNYNTFFKSDFIQPNTGMWVVSNVSNIGYDSVAKSVHPISIDYRYSGMLLHKLGRGSAGFDTLETTDNTTGIVTTTQYSQAYPYIGMPISTTQVYDGKTLSQATNAFAKKASTTTTGTYPYISLARDKKWRLLSSSLVGGNTTNVAFASHSTLASTYDDYGNLKISTSKQFADAANTSTAVLSQVATTNVYDGLGGGEAKGRLSSSSVTHTRGSASKTRTSSFDYNADDGMLAWAKIDGLNQKTTYEYDPFGNKEKVCVIDETPNHENTTESRCSFTTWSGDGRFALSVTNAVGSAFAQSESYLYNGQAAAVNGRIWSKTTTGPNGIATTQYFDIQGQVIKEQRADGTTSHITRAYSSGTNTSNCLANTDRVCFYERAQSTAKPDSYTWYDAYGRKIKTQVKAFDGSKWASQSFLFDELSRGIVTYEPYYENSANGSPTSPTWDNTSYAYDVLGRVTQETLPDGANNQRKYEALANHYIDDNNITRIEQINALGEVTKITTPTHSVVSNGNQTSEVNITTITDYHYNVFGKLNKVDNYASNDDANKVSIHTVYDNQGRKTAMYDPDKGHWQYDYNAFGELTQQTSANNKISTHYYDVLGRKTKSTEQALGSYSASVQCYQYGTSRAAKNVGKLVKQQHFTSTNSNLANFNCANNANTPATWQQSVNFDLYGRLAKTTTQFEGKTFTQGQTYDSYGRMNTQTLPEGFVVTTQYQNNYLKRIKQGSLILRQVDTMDAAGRVKTETLGSNMSKTNDYDSVGRVANIELTKVGNQTLHSLNYVYDGVGNIKERNQFYDNNSTHFKEDFLYDNLNRIKTRNVEYHDNFNYEQLNTAFSYQQNYRYDFIGNITRKYSSVGNSPTNTAEDYKYNYQWKTHNNSISAYPLKRRGLVSVQKGSTSNYRKYSYDNNGNVTNDGSRTYQYTPFDKSWLISSNTGDVTQTSEFKYANRSRYMRIDDIQEQDSNGNNYASLTNYKTYYVGAYEQIERIGGAGNQTEHKYQIAGAVFTRKEGQSSFSTLFAHTDYQGSVVTVTDKDGQVAEQFIYDPWGKKTKVVITNPNVPSLVSGLTRGTATTRGYTGHEGINHFALIHMNGRVYDAEIGRFLQADPFIQAPKNSQNYNRYSYVLNNPMSYTDPSGYLFSGLKKRFRKSIRSVSKILGKGLTNFIGQVASAWCGPYAAACSAAWSYEFNRAHGASSTGSLRAAAVAGVNTYVNGPPQFNAQSALVAAEIVNPDVGRAVNFLYNGVDYKKFDWKESAAHLGHGVKNQYIFKGVERFANKNGLTLSEFNALLTLNSFVGNYVAGSRYDEFNNEMGGFTYRRNGMIGVFWDINDTILGYQGLLDASGNHYITSNNVGMDISNCHSLGTLTCNNLVARGHAPSAQLNSLPFMNIAVGVNATSANLGKWDIVNGGWLGRIFNPMSNSTDCANGSSSGAFCHGWNDNYRARKPL